MAGKRGKGIKPKGKRSKAKKNVSQAQLVVNAVKKLNRATGDPYGRYVPAAVRGGVAGIGRIFGLGDYTVRGNVFARSSSVLSGDVPTFSGNQESTTVEHREYLKDVATLANGVFQNDPFIINPANAATFPWLSTIAKNYEQWEPLGIVFVFRSTCGSYNGTSLALGSVMMATDYDIADAPYATKTEAANAFQTVTAKPSESQIHPIECEPAQRPTRLLYTAAVSATDKRLSDLGRFQLITVGTPGATPQTIGELWVSYRIRFHKPQVPAA
jgi:hypothetical protein